MHRGIPVYAESSSKRTGSLGHGVSFRVLHAFEVLNLTTYEVLEGLTRDFHFDKDIRQAPAGCRASDSAIRPS
jgi:pyridoxal biosynthesis lyase PdxS